MRRYFNHIGVGFLQKWRCRIIYPSILWGSDAELQSSPTYLSFLIEFLILILQNGVQNRPDTFERPQNCLKMSNFSFFQLLLASKMESSAVFEIKSRILLFLKSSESFSKKFQMQNFIRIFPTSDESLLWTKFFCSLLCGVVNFWWS